MKEGVKGTDGKLHAFRGVAKKSKSKAPFWRGPLMYLIIKYVSDLTPQARAQPAMVEQLALAPRNSEVPQQIEQFPPKWPRLASTVSDYLDRARLDHGL
jgi:hypothetical protein